MTINEIHDQYGERIKRTLVSACDLESLEASQVLLQTLAAISKIDLKAKLDAGGGQRYPVLPFVLNIAFRLADLARVRRWAPANMRVWDELSLSSEAQQ